MVPITVKAIIKMGCWFIILLPVLQLAAAVQNYNIEPMIAQTRMIESSNFHDTCPPQEEIQAVRMDIRNNINDAVQVIKLLAIDQCA